MQTLPDDRTVSDVLESLALTAGRRIEAIRARGCSTETKADSSPVTEADREAEAIILAGLRESFPDIPVVAEEEAAEGHAPDSVGTVFFLVDPLDGTREFVSGNGDFTVNIALVREGIPVIGVVYAPARQELYSGYPGSASMVATDADHNPLERRAIVVREGCAPLTVVASRSHNTPETDVFIGRYEPALRVSVGSSLKFCLLACGQADLYPRLGRTMQWDTAAGDAVLRAAGGMTRTLDGKPFRYGVGTAEGDAPFANPHFIAEGRLPRD